MTDNIKRFGDGFISCKSTEYLNNGLAVEVETVDIDLSNTLCISKLSIDNIDTSMAIDGQVLAYNNGKIEWTDVKSIPDRELREQYPSLQISWDRVMEAMNEYELVKKLVQDYD